MPENPTPSGLLQPDAANNGNAGAGAIDALSLFRRLSSATVATSFQPSQRDQFGGQIYNRSNTNLANLATQLGYSAIGSGNRSTAVGSFAYAREDSAVALGVYALALGPSSVAIGDQALSSGYRSITIGNQGQGNALGAISIGFQARALGVNSIAIGSQAYAIGANAISIGASARTVAAYSIALGALASVPVSNSPGALAIGANANVTGAFGAAIALGAGATVLGTLSPAIAIGSNATVTSPGREGIAIGTNALVSARGAQAYGEATTASFTDSVAFGRATITTSTNQMMVGNPTFPLSVNISGPRPWIDVIAYGAMADGVTDDYAFIAAAVTAATTAGGATIFFPPGTYRITQRLNINASDITLLGLGSAEILFDPTAPITAANDRAIAIYSTSIAAALSNPASTRRPITGGIVLGATSFVATNASDTADLVAGDWIGLQEIDTPRADVYYFDMMQVRSVAGTTVNVYNSFRTIFPGTHAGATFTRITGLVENAGIRNLDIRSIYNVATVNGVTFGEGSRSCMIDNCIIRMTQGAAITIYLSSDLKVTQNSFLSGPSINAEFAASVDVVIEGNLFGALGVQNVTSAVTLDFGLGHFSFADNLMINAGNIGMQVLYGVHDGTISGDHLGWVRDAGIGLGQGMSGLGCYNLRVVGNTLIGGDAGGGNTGIFFGDDTTASPNVLSTNVIVFPNNVINFTYPYGSGEPGPNIGDVVVLKQATNPFIRLTRTSATTQSWDINGGTDFSVADATASATAFNIIKSGTKIRFWNWATLENMIRGTRTTTSSDYSANPIATASGAFFDITVTGAVAGDTAIVNPNPTPNSLLTWAAVTGANIVRVQVINTTTGSIIPTTATWTAFVIRSS